MLNYISVLIYVLFFLEQRGHLSLGSKKSELHFSRGNWVRRHKICLREASVVVSTSCVFSRLFIAY
uniref:Uncharacterized protein n=1 Tax=Aegilops tauschii subsp. strangulata TaxID=200361 RepID=A0A453MV68_AEGTS